MQAAHFVLQDASCVTADASWEANAATAVLDLVLKLTQTEDLRTAARLLANEMQSHLGCARVAVGLRHGRSRRNRVVAVSGVADVDSRSETAAQLEMVLDEAVLHDAMTIWPPAGDELRALPVAHRKMATALEAGGTISVPLRAADGAILGAWTMLGTREFVLDARNRRVIDAATQAAGPALQVVSRAQGGPIRRAWRNAGRAMPWLRGKTLWAVAAVVAAAMFLPIPYYVAAECELQPVVRRYVAAPHAGEFQKSLARSGDLVRRGQVLGRMDGREIRWELTGLTAEQERARKSRDVNMAAAKTAAAQIDQLDIDRQQVKRRLLEDRLANLEIKSPVDGILVSGDLERSEGAPVSVGQVLYEVAPLDHMTAELAIADEDIANVEVGITAALRLDAHPGSSWSGPISRIHPRSVTREKDNVFLGEILLDNADGALRPGMKGHARVRAGNRCLGWVLFHKPWNYLRSWLDL